MTRETRPVAFADIDPTRLPDRRLLIALSVSLLAHGALLFNFAQLSPGVLERSRGSLQITLKEASREDLIRPEPAAEASPASPVLALARASEKPAPSPDKPLLRKLERRTAGRAPAAPVLPSSPSLAVENEPKALGIPLPGLSGRVRRATIAFDVFAGVERQRIASGQHRFVAAGDQFGISISEAQAEAGADSWHIEISGRIGPRGLSPFLYEAQGRLSQRLLAIRSGADSRPAAAQKWRMPDGIVDRQSLLYYFMHQPLDLLGGQILLADGVSNAPFSYRFGGAESYPIAAYGAVNAIRIVFSTSESAETIELWVVPDLHYLPVKVRHIDAQGAITEQAATSLDFN